MKQSLWEISAQVSEHTGVALVMTDELLTLPDTEVAAVSRNIQDSVFKLYLLSFGGDQPLRLEKLFQARW